MILFKLILCFVCVVVLWHYSTRKYLNPHKLIFIFGKKGCGKSTLLTKIAYENLKKGRAVYSTEDVEITIRDKKTRKKITLKTIPFEPNRIFDTSLPPNSLVLIDEVNLLWDNRDFRSMDKRVIQWFRLQRHYKVECILFSQTFDIDKKLRDLCDEMFICQKFARVFTIARHVVRKPVIVHPSGDAPASIQDDIIEDGILLAPFGGMKVAFIPYWARRFDSFKLSNNLKINSQ